MSTNPQRILIAEDEHLVAEVLKSDLVQLGYEVIGPFPNGAAALQGAHEKRPDLVLMDIRMNGDDGIDSAREFYRTLNVPVVLLSAYSSAEYLKNSMEAGVFGYLLKPVTQDELRVAIGVAWQRYLDSNDLKSQVGDLEKKLEDRKLVERAKGILQTKLGISEPEAMKRLQKQARDARRPMAELAKSVIDAEELMH